MDVFTQPVSQILSLVAENSLAFNPDIFETNVVNLSILVAGVYYLSSKALSEVLEARQQGIVAAIQNAEEGLAKAVARLKESETQLEQAQLVIDSIRQDAEKTARQVKSAIYNGGKEEVDRLTTVANSQIAGLEAKARKQISDYVVGLALERVTSQLEGKLRDETQHQIIDRNISKL